MDRVKSLTRLKKRLAAGLLTAMFWLLAVQGTAWAHKVSIFAWVEGDTVYTQSKFSGGRKAQQSTVVVYDPAGRQLLEGQTDADGLFAFKVPQKTALKIALKASMGHLAEWTLPLEEILAAAGSTVAGPGAAKPPGAAGPREALLSPSTQAEPAALGTDNKAAALQIEPQVLQQMIDQALDKKLAPVIRMLADAADRGPGLTEIIGGLGYIFGLVGVALYMTQRGSRKQ